MNNKEHKKVENIQLAGVTLSNLFGVRRNKELSKVPRVTYTVFLVMQSITETQKLSKFWFAYVVPCTVAIPSWSRKLLIHVEESQAEASVQKV